MSELVPPTQILRSPVQVIVSPAIVSTEPVAIGPVVQVFENLFAKVRQSLSESLYAYTKAAVSDTDVYLSI